MEERRRGMKILFMDGEFLPAERGVISVHTHSFSMGTGCLEGIRGYWNDGDRQIYLFRLREHYERLLRSCKVMHITVPYTVKELMEITVELLRRNAPTEDVYVRVVAYKSEEGMNVRLHGVPDGLILTVIPMGDFVNVTGLRCGVSSWRRIDD